MDIKMALYEHLQPAFGAVEVIRAEDNGPRPAGGYVTFATRWTNGWPASFGRVDDDGRQDVTVQADVTVELHAYRESAYESLKTIVARLQAPSALDRAEALGIAVRSFGQLQDLPALRDGARFEPHAVLEMVVGFAFTVTDDVGYIERVEIGFSTTGGAQSPPDGEVIAVLPPA